MINFERYLSQLLELLQAYFETRLLYVGLQVSYLRGEATDHSDIDIMVIIDDLSVSDLAQYRDTIQSMEHFDKSCGFICSKTDLANWNPLEIWHLLNGTKDYYGTLSTFVPAYTEQDIRHYAKLSINNLYHEICHRYIHAASDQNITGLPFTYKGVFFILQALYYLQNGEYVASKADLLPLLNGKNHAVLARSIDFTNGISHDFNDSFALLFTWCQEALQSI